MGFPIGSHRKPLRTNNLRVTAKFGSQTKTKTEEFDPIQPTPPHLNMSKYIQPTKAVGMVMARVPHGRSETSPSSQKEKKKEKGTFRASPFAKPRAASPAWTAQGPGHPPTQPKRLQMLVASSTSRSEVGLLCAWPWVALPWLEGKWEQHRRAIGCELRSEIGISDMSQNSKQTPCQHRRTSTRDASAQK